MLIWAVYVMLVSAALSLAAFMFERTACLRRLPTRGIWVASLAASLLLPIIISSVSLPLPAVLRRDLPSLPTQLLPLRQLTSTALSPSIWLNGTIGPADTRPDVDHMLVYIWLSASSIMFLALLNGVIQLHLRKRNWVRGVVCGTPVFIAEDTGPAIVGLFLPRIVVPRWLTSRPHEDQELVILHEASHLQAHDARLLVLALLLITSMPWNLPLWWQFKRLRDAIELDCDARVLRHGGDVARYGNILLTVGARHIRHLTVVAAMSESGTLLERRIHYMLGTPRDMVSLPAMLAAGLAFCFAALATEFRPPSVIYAGTASAMPASSAAALDHYVGYYEMPGDMVMTISRSGNQLSAGVSGEPAFPIIQTSLGTFHYKVADIELTFVLDQQSVARIVIFHEYGMERNFPRIDATAAKRHNDELTTRVQNQTPDPRSKAALLDILKAIVIDKPNYTGISAGKAALAQKTIFGNKNLVQAVTKLGRSGIVNFSQVTAEGMDVYYFMQGGSTWYFGVCLDDNGQVSVFTNWVRRHQ